MTVYSGLLVEVHQVLTGRDVCVWYRNGERRAVLYAHESEQRLRLVHEPDVRVDVLRRAQAFRFDQRPEAGTYVLEITPSERMALLDVLAAYIRTDEPQNFVNCSTPEPCEETSTGDLLLLVSDARFEK